MQRLRVGLIGLGVVAQIVHIPVLRGLEDKFEIVAGCDVSLDYAQAVCTRYAVPRAYDSLQAMLANEQLDALAVLNSDEYHRDTTIAALDAGLHVLLEKPAALTLADIDSMAAAREAAGKSVMVGYMRRHASAYSELRAEIAAESAIRHVAVRDIIGPNDYFINQSAHITKLHQLPPALIQDKQGRAANAVKQSLGDATALQAKAFRLLTGLSSHDLSALRGLIGPPHSVMAAKASGNGQFISALLDYGSFTATFETGMDTVGHFDATIEVFTGSRRLCLTYDTPYIRHLPTRLSTMSSTGEELVRSERRPSFRDPYTNQWNCFHTALTAGGTFEETLEDARHDIEVAVEITRQL